MITRRDMLKATAGLGSALPLLAATLDDQAAQPPPSAPPGVDVNDMQSQLNLTRVSRVVSPRSIDDIAAALREARTEGRAVSVCGGRHSMGGQQFGCDAILLDMSQFNRVLRLDNEKGLLEVQAGIQWPELIEHLHREQAGSPKPWGIRQKQTGVDRVSIGGSLASNIHGRGLRFPPIIGDVESFVLVDADGKLHSCSRRENSELFSLAIGGYGLFGVIAHVTLRLVPRAKVQRIVEVIPVRDLLASIEKRKAEGFVYGDCQYATDMTGDPGEHPGVLSCYRPVDDSTPIPLQQKQLSKKDWADLYALARSDKKQAFDRYSKYYLTTSGQVYWSDLHQLSGDFQGYRDGVKPGGGTEVITEGYVGKDAFLDLLTRNREDFVQHNVDMTYGTIRFIEKDSESFLPWAAEPSVCTVCNLHVLHTDEGRRKAAEDFRRIIDRLMEHGGRFFLTYHRHATRRQIEACYPQFADFLRLKRKHDPHERFQSEWYRHMKAIFQTP